MAISQHEEKTGDFGSCSERKASVSAYDAKETKLLD